MKKNSFLFLAMMSMFSLTWTGCTDSVDYTPAEAVEGQGVYFPKSVITSYTLKDVKGEINLDVYRTNKSGGFDAPLTVSINESGDKLFKIPATVPFADGQDSTSISITFDNLVRGTNYEVSLSFADATVYGNSSIKLNVIYPKAKEYKWEVVSDEAVYIDNLFSMYGASDISFAKDLGRKIVVEKAHGLNMFRFQSPYDNDYFDTLFGMVFFPEDYKFPYIVLDGETYKEHNLWYIKSMNLGFQMVEGAGPKFDTEWNTFGSVAGNLKTADGPIPPTSTDFPLGTYDKKTRCFDFGVTYHNLGNYGMAVNTASFKLYLDPKLMEPDFLRDYTWEEVKGSLGQFTSELADGETTFTSVLRAKEDSTFYCIPQIYSKEGNLFFNIKEDGTVNMPKKQKTGLETYGNPIFMEATPGESKFDQETQILTLGVTFYLADEQGNKIADLKSGLETFMWGKSEVDLLTPGKSIDDYVGTYKVDAFEYGKGLIGEAPVTLVKTGDNSLAIKGLSFSDFDDTCVLEIDPKTGLLALKSQQLADLQPGMPMIATLFNSKTDQTELSGDTNDVMLGGFSGDNVLKFVNSIQNEVRWDGFMYFVVQDGKALMLTGMYSGFDWVKQVEAPAKSWSVAPALTPFVQRVTAPEFKVTLNKEPYKKSNEDGNKIVTKCMKKSIKL